jgi:nucleotide-binding universal stress UspA family protein
VFERIIVTLDGSSSSEAALPAAEGLARRLGSSLLLLHVIEARPPKEVHGERHLATVAEAESYLAPIVDRLKAEGLAASSHVHDSGAAHEAGGAAAVSGTRGVVASVAAHEVEFGNDLAVMAAHGKHGLSETLSGSLPLKVAASGGAAVLLVPRPREGPGGPAAGPADPAPRSFAPRGILLPLDGRPEHEAALPAVLSLARAFGLHTRLLAVVPRSGAEAGGPGALFARLSPALSGASLEYAAEGVGAYLAGVAERFAREGLAADWRVLRGRPVKAIVAAAEEGELLVLSTHRKLGLDASLEGCVAFGVAQAWRGAMLVVPVPR